jgi:ferredoxin
MANITFSSPRLAKDVTVYAVAGDRQTILTVAKANKIGIPFECGEGNCGSCLMEVTPLGTGKMAFHLTEKERAALLSLGKVSKAELDKLDNDDVAPKWRLACQYMVQDQDVLVRFSGLPGGAA